MRNFIKAFSFRVHFESVFSTLETEKTKLSVEYMISEPLSPNIVMLGLPNPVKKTNDSIDDYGLFLCYIDPLKGLSSHKIKLADLKKATEEEKNSEILNEDPWLIGQLNDHVGVAMVFSGEDKTHIEIAYANLYFIEKERQGLKPKIPNISLWFPYPRQGDLVSGDKE